MNKYRIEKDEKGEISLPENAYYGIHTQRAIEKYPPVEINLNPLLIKSYAYIKKATAIINSKFNYLNKNIAQAIIKASDDLINGLLLDQIKVNTLYDYDGTFLNSNLNELITNRALEILNHRPGSYNIINPYNHTNLNYCDHSASFTALKIATIYKHKNLTKKLLSLIHVLKSKAKKNNKFTKQKSLLTCNTKSINLDKIFTYYAFIIANHIKNLKIILRNFYFVSFSPISINTKNEAQKFNTEFIKTLSQLTNLHLKKVPQPLGQIQSMYNFTYYSSSLKNLSLDLINMSSSIMHSISSSQNNLIENHLSQNNAFILPIQNYSILEMTLTIYYQVIANDLAISLSSKTNSTKLNMPILFIANNLLSSMNILENAINLFINEYLK